MFTPTEEEKSSGEKWLLCTALSRLRGREITDAGKRHNSPSERIATAKRDAGGKNAVQWKQLREKEQK